MSDNSAIKKDMTFGEVLQKYPKAAEILMGYGLHCIGCHVAVTETLEQGIRAHGHDDNTLEKILLELNEKATV